MIEIIMYRKRVGADYIIWGENYINMYMMIVIMKQI